MLSSRKVEPDRSKVPKNLVPRQKGDPGDPLQAVAPIPGMVTLVNAKIGDKIEEGDPIITLEAMKMLTTVSAGTSGSFQKFSSRWEIR